MHGSPPRSSEPAGKPAEAIAAPAPSKRFATPWPNTGMTVVALLSVAPVIEGSMSAEVAKAVDALEGFDVRYETNPMGTVIEADDVGTLFAAAQAAHEAVDADRVSTVLKIDDKRTQGGRARKKVEAVEERLGRPARGGE